MYKLGGEEGGKANDRYMVIGIYTDGQYPAVFTAITREVNQWIKQTIDGTEDVMCNQFNTCNCGLRNYQQNENRIVESNEAKLGEFPWIVFIKIFGGPGFCGGTLITRNHVMSAAHSFHPKGVEDYHSYAPEQIRVKTGLSVLNREDEKKSTLYGTYIWVGSQSLILNSMESGFFCRLPYGS